jgi:beta-glucosidase
MMGPGGDRASLRLRPDDEALIAAAREVSERVVVVVMTGSAVVMPWLDDVPATMIVWYPGLEGGHALADVLLGIAEPGGRLPFAVPVDERDLVPFDNTAEHVTYDLLHGQWWLDEQGAATHRPFGFGLGYTTFTLRDAAVADRRSDGGGVRASVDVANTGDRAGSTVVQVYAAVPDSGYRRPPRRLVGFRRVRLPAGEHVRVEVPVDLRHLRVRVDGGWLVEEASVELTVGEHAHDRALTVQLGR